MCFSGKCVGLSENPVIAVFIFVEALKCKGKDVQNCKPFLFC
jgi:hypothetical protein